MGKLDRFYNPQYYSELPLEDSYQHRTEKQWNYIRVLSKDLGYSDAILNVKITELVGRKFEYGFHERLSVQEANKTIQHLKEWKRKAKYDG